MFTLGRYEIFDAIGVGGMATVYLARSVGPGGFSRVVAVKRLNEQFARDPEFVGMFVDEARVASRIRHPNVVQVFDVVSLEGELFLVLEYVHGASLARLLDPEHFGGPVPPAIAVSLFVGILAGLHAAHEARDESGRALQIVHRDVSPQNVLVGDDGSAHLVDFGVAKAIGRSQVTRDGALKGKLPYMAPEQLRGEAVTRAADVYSASVTLWEALTGRHLFDAEEQPALVVQVLSEPVRPPSAFVPAIPAALDAVVMRGLDRERTRRFPTAAAMARALEEAITPASVHAVADWLRERAGGEIAERARAVAEVETTPIGIDVPAVAAARLVASPPVHVEPAAVEAPARRRVPVVVLAGVAVACAAFAIALRSEQAPTSDASPSSSASVVAPATAAEVESAAPPVSAAPSPPPSSAPESSSAPDPRPPRVHAPRTVTHAPKTPADRCDPPYTLEGDHKVWKRNCL